MGIINELLNTENRILDIELEYIACDFSIFKLVQLTEDLFMNIVCQYSLSIRVDYLTFSIANK
jgi:hypothetical protein